MATATAEKDQQQGKSTQDAAEKKERTKRPYEVFERVALEDLDAYMDQHPNVDEVLISLGRVEATGDTAAIGSALGDEDGAGRSFAAISRLRFRSPQTKTRVSRSWS